MELKDLNGDERTALVGLMREVVMSDANPPTVDSLALVVDGNALSVANGMGGKVGSASVAVDGKTYTITGQAAGADLKNPMAGMITKDFSIKVTCG